MFKQFSGVTILIFTLSLVQATGCGPKSGFQNLAQLTSPPQNKQDDGIKDGDGDDNQKPPPDEDWSKIEGDLIGYNYGGSEHGKLTIRVDKTKRLLVLMLPLPELFLIPLSAGIMKELPGATLEEETNSEGKKVWGIGIPLKYILKDAGFPDFATLPNGDPLPFFPAGEVSGLAISLKQNTKYQLNIYFAYNAVAIYLTTPDMDELYDNHFPKISYSVVNKAKTKTIGYFELVLPKPSFSSGVYLAARIPDSTAKKIKEILKY